MRTAGRLCALGLLLLVLLSGGAVEAQFPLGAEFLVSSYTTSRQARPAIASDSAGNFVVVWHSSGQDGSDSSFGVFGQRYASSGAPLGIEFQVNSYTTDNQVYPGIAFDSAGSFVVVWFSAFSAGQDGSAFGIFGQRYASSGAPFGTEFQINTYTSGSQMFPAVALDSAGGYFVVWQSKDQDGSYYGVFGQRYGSSGGRNGTEFRVNSFTTDRQMAPAIAFSSTGSFVVVWQSNYQDGSSYGVLGQRYAGSGVPLGVEFQINSYTSSSQVNSAIASDSTGNFTVVWFSCCGQDGSGNGVFGQRYSSSGARLGTEFQVNSYTSTNQRFPAIASDQAGNFTVVWQSGYGQDGASFGVFGQRYSSSGSRLGAEFRANTTTPGTQALAAIASDSAGDFVVAWEDYDQDGSEHGIFAQRFCPQALSAVSVSSTGSLSVCTNSTGGTVNVTDTGGGANLHQWFYRALPGGMYIPLGQTGSAYIISGGDFMGPGLYAIVCRTTPTASCGTAITSAENVQVTVSQENGTPPVVTPPALLRTTQSLCQ